MAPQAGREQVEDLLRNLLAPLWLLVCRGRRDTDRCCDGGGHDLGLGIVEADPYIVGASAGRATRPPA
jgi:hypothetical protein